MIVDRIKEEFKSIKKQQLKPDIIWVGKAERRELEDLGIGPDINGSFKYEGVDVRFVYSESWFSISCQQ